jgi:RNA polymerase primary sigma factor
VLHSHPTVQAPPRYPRARRRTRAALPRPYASERDLVLAAREPGPERDRLVQTFMPLVGRVARTYRGSPGVGRTELMQEGVVGLLRALERYDPSLGTPFWAYASWWVRQAMQQVVSELTGPMVLSDRAARQLARVKKAHLVHLQTCRAEPSPRELAASTGLPADQVQRLIAADRRPRGLDEPGGGEGDNAGTIGDGVADPDADAGYEQLADWTSIEQLPTLLDTLSPRERTVIAGRYGLDGGEMTLRELGSQLGLSAERVRQVEHEALGKLRDVIHEPADADDRPLHR